MHEAIKGQCPPAYPGVRAAWAEILAALRQQAHDVSYQVNRPVPAQAGLSL